MIKIQKNEKGNARIVLETSPEVAQKLEKMYRSGQLKEIAGIPIDSIELGESRFLKKLVKLRQWFDNQFTLDWQPQTLLPVAVRSKRLRKREERVLGFKVFNLGEVSVTLVISQTPDTEDAEIEVTVYPNAGQEYLPEGLRFSILDEFGEIIPIYDDNDEIVDCFHRIATEQKRMMRLELVEDSGELFQVRLILGTITVTEWFEI